MCVRVCVFLCSRLPSTSFTHNEMAHIIFIRLCFKFLVDVYNKNYDGVVRFINCEQHVRVVAFSLCVQRGDIELVSGDSNNKSSSSGVGRMSFKRDMSDELKKDTARKDSVYVCVTHQRWKRANTDDMTQATKFVKRARERDRRTNERVAHERKFAMDRKRQRRQLVKCNGNVVRVFCWL